MKFWALFTLAKDFESIHLGDVFEARALLHAAGLSRA